VSLRAWWREHQLYRSWRARYQYREWALELRRQLVAYGMQVEALQELVQAKQDKINRLQEYIRTEQQPPDHSRDMRPERLLNTRMEVFEKFSKSFELRMQEYERTGTYDPQEPLTRKYDDPAENSDG
jgi:uncharacterized coiled-coil DUF342 family protein